MRQPAGEAFNADKLNNRESGLGDFGPQFLRTVKVRRGEPVRVVVGVDVPAVGKVLTDDLPELGVEDELAHKAVEERSETADRGNGNDASWADDPARLTQGEHSVSSLDKVVERSEQQRGVDPVSGYGQTPSIADSGGEASPSELGTCLANELRCDVEEIHDVAVVEQPRRVHPRSAADVEDATRRTREMSPQDLLGAGQLQLSNAAGQPPLLTAGLVVADHRVNVVAHAAQR
jgi:hypothetical protein